MNWYTYSGGDDMHVNRSILNVQRVLALWCINGMIDIISSAIGQIRKAIVKSKKEIHKLDDETEIKEYKTNISLLLKIINKGVSNIQENDRSVILQVYQAIKDAELNEMGMELLDVLQTMDLNE